MKALFSSLDFWKLFVFREHYYIDREVLNTQIAQLKNNFRYDEESTINESYNGENYLSITTNFEIEFSCGENYSIVLDYKIHISDIIIESEQALMLLNKSTKEKSILAWNNGIDHPSCIAPEEFELLTKYWENNDDKWKNTNYSKLLLIYYVGFHNPTQVAEMKEEILKEFGFHGIPELTETGEHLIYIRFNGECRYKWLKIENIGWVYQSETYNCYSIRNECHLKGGIYVFPFQEWAKMIEQVEKSLNLKCEIKTDECNWTYETKKTEYALCDTEINDIELGEDFPF
mgnify:FL=1